MSVKLGRTDQSYGPGKGTDEVRLQHSNGEEEWRSVKDVELVPLEATRAVALSQDRRSRKASK